MEAFSMRSMKPRGYGPNQEWGDAGQILLVLCEGFYHTSETHACWPGRYSPQHPLDYCIRSLLANIVETTIQPMFNTESVVCFKGLKWLCHFPNYSIFVGPPKQTSLLFQDVVDDVIPRHKLGFQLFWLYSPFSTHIDMENPAFVDYCPKGKPLVSPTKPFRKPLLIKKVSNG